MLRSLLSKSFCALCFLQAKRCRGYGFACLGVVDDVGEIARYVEGYVALAQRFGEDQR